MDNIQKMIAGCLALVGLIVLIVPNSDPLASKKLEAGQVASADGVPAPPPPPPPASTPPPAANNNGEESGGFVVNDSDIANFGKPMVDPTPLSERTQPGGQEQNQPQQNNNGMQQTSGDAGNFGAQPQMNATNTGPIPPT